MAINFDRINAAAKLNRQQVLTLLENYDDLPRAARAALKKIETSFARGVPADLQMEAVKVAQSAVFTFLNDLTPEAQEALLRQRNPENAKRFAAKCGSFKELSAKALASALKKLDDAEASKLVKRVQRAFADDEEVQRVVARFLKSASPKPAPAPATGGRRAAAAPAADADNVGAKVMARINRHAKALQVSDLDTITPSKAMRLREALEQDARFDALREELSEATGNLRKLRIAIENLMKARRSSLQSELATTVTLAEAAANSPAEDEKPAAGGRRGARAPAKEDDVDHVAALRTILEEGDVKAIIKKVRSENFLAGRGEAGALAKLLGVSTRALNKHLNVLRTTRSLKEGGAAVDALTEMLDAVGDDAAPQKEEPRRRASDKKANANTGRRAAPKQEELLDDEDAEDGEDGDGQAEFDAKVNAINEQIDKAVSYAAKKDDRRAEAALMRAHRQYGELIAQFDDFDGGKDLDAAYRKALNLLNKNRDAGAALADFAAAFVDATAELDDADGEELLDDADGEELLDDGESELPEGEELLDDESELPEGEELLDDADGDELLDDEEREPSELRKFLAKANTSVIHGVGSRAQRNAARELLREVADKEFGDIGDEQNAMLDQLIEALDIVADARNTEEVTSAVSLFAEIFNELLDLVDAEVQEDSSEEQHPLADVASTALDIVNVADGMRGAGKKWRAERDRLADLLDNDDTIIGEIEKELAGVMRDAGVGRQEMLKTLAQVTAGLSHLDKAALAESEAAFDRELDVVIVSLNRVLENSAYFPEDADSEQDEGLEAGDGDELLDDEQDDELEAEGADELLDDEQDEEPAAESDDLIYLKDKLAVFADETANANTVRIAVREDQKNLIRSLKAVADEVDTDEADELATRAVSSIDALISARTVSVANTAIEALVAAITALIENAGGALEGDDELLSDDDELIDDTSNDELLDDEEEEAPKVNKMRNLPRARTLEEAKASNKPKRRADDDEDLEDKDLKVNVRRLRPAATGRRSL